MKSLLRVLGGAITASLVAFILITFGIALEADGDRSAPRGLLELGPRLGLFFLISLVGYAVLRALLRARRLLALYLAGGLILGVVATAVSVGLNDPRAALRFWVVMIGAVSGLAGALPVSGSGSRAPPPEPLEPRGRE